MLHDKAGMVVFKLHDLWAKCQSQVLLTPSRNEDSGVLHHKWKSWPPFPDTNHSLRSSVQVQRALENNNKKIERGMLLHKAK
jgi:hypothetical protein